jgi:hypothetical protein
MGLFTPDWKYVNSVRSQWIEKMETIFIA